MADQNSIANDQMVEPNYNAGFIVLSYLVSFVGCATTLELLHRRTSCFGLYNWYLLITSSISMGGVGIWCMHFIGNRAIVFGDGKSQYQIYYSSGFTAVSFFLPIAVLMLAFYLIGANEKASFIHISVAGTMTGTAVSGMHYVGQLGIANYNCQYDVPNIVGAAAIAVFASLVALSIFFLLRASWTNSWWKRTLCSSTLAVAVSGMHWTAAVGTSYVYRELDLEPETRLSSTQTVVVCTILACAACILLITFAIIANRKRKRSANRARQLVLACAFFDQSGRVMVTPEGLLPSHKITNHYIERTFADDEFSRTHPAFIWAFRATRNWPALKRLIPRMKEHLVSDESSRRFCPGNGTLPDTGVELDVEFELIFKELFCVAAQELAEQIHQPLDKMGVLYEDVMATGTHSEPFPNNALLSQQQKNSMQASNMTDPENASIPYMFGKGQFVFAIRQVSKQEAARLAATGFRFAATSQIAFTLSRSMQVSQDEMLNRLDRMREYSATEMMMEPGVHVACFCLHPSIRRGFEVLVYSHARNILPFVPIPLDHITKRQLEILSRMDDWTLVTCVRWLKNNGGGFTDLQDRGFCEKMYKAVSSLAEFMNDSAFGQAKFSSRRIMVPCRPTPRSYTPGKCTVFFFRIVMGIHSRVVGPQFTLSPLPFFNAQQQVYTGVADHESFLLQLHREFAHCSEKIDTKKGSSAGLSSSQGISPPGSPTPSNAGISGIRKHRLSRAASILENGSTNGKDDDENSNSGMNSPDIVNPNPTFGGIMVSNQVTVDISENSSSSAKPHHNSHINSSSNKADDSQSSFEMRDLSVTVEAGFANTCGETFVDELCAMCRVSTGRQAQI